MSAIAESRVLEAVLHPIGECLTPEVARRIADVRASAATQARLDDLAERNTRGLLTPDETAEYRTFVNAINFISVLQADARALLRRLGET